MPIILYVIGSVALVSLVSFVGVLGVSLSQKRLNQALAFLVPLAVGALLGDAFFHLIPESFAESINSAEVSLIVIIGILSFFFLEKVLRWHHSSREKFEPAKENPSPSHLGKIIIISDAFHNFIDGIIIAVSYIAGIEIGIATTLAVVLHEIPQEIGDFGVLIYSGYKKATALLYNFLSALFAVFGALLVMLFGSFPEGLIQAVVPFAAGIFIYIASSDLVPELHKSSGGKSIFAQGAGLFAGVFAMYLLVFLA